MGTTLMEANELALASNYFRQAIQLQPNYIDAHYNLGNSLREQKKYQLAIIQYTKVIEINSKHIKSRLNIASIFDRKGQFDKALDEYQRVIEIDANCGQAYSSMGSLLRRKGDKDGAINCYERALQISPDNESVRHLMSALTEGSLDSAPAEYVESLFDSYASHFEESLQKLDYQTPHLIMSLLKKFKSDGPINSVLDLGCGTGLFGEKIQGLCQNIEGVDLSKAMLEEARKKNIYKRLKHGDIIEHLATIELDFDYFVAADVFVYVGDLSRVFHLIKSRNKRRGKLIFSTEHSGGSKFDLQDTGRFSHSKKYIEGLCREHDYHLSYFRETSLRKDLGEVIKGAIYLLDF